MKDILEKQLELQKLIAITHRQKLDDPSTFDGHIDNKTVCDYIKDQSFFMSGEVTELMIEVGNGDRSILKPWSTRHADLANRIFVSTPDVKSEAIDMLCFCMNICLAAGITPENIEVEFYKVWQKNIDRQMNGY